MTEAEWIACSDPTRMLEFLRDRASDRKLRLFAVACCRWLMRTVLASPMRGHGLNVAERYADGEISVEELAAAQNYSSSPISKEFGLNDAVRGDSNDAEAACINATEIDGGTIMADCAAGNAAWAAAKHGKEPPHDNSASPIFNARFAVEQSNQCDLVRDIFGNPFCKVFLHPVWPVWKNDTIYKLAQAIYDYRAFDWTPELGDALKDAGCTDHEILAHCRKPGPHVRGCWVVDVLLGKE